MPFLPEVSSHLSRGVCPAVDAELARIFVDVRDVGLGQSLGHELDLGLVGRVPLALPFTPHLPLFFGLLGREDLDPAAVLGGGVVVVVDHRSPQPVDVQRTLTFAGGAGTVTTVRDERGPIPAPGGEADGRDQGLAGGFEGLAGDVVGAALLLGVAPGGGLEGGLGLEDGRDHLVEKASGGRIAVGVGHVYSVGWLAPLTKSL